MSALATSSIVAYCNYMEGLKLRIMRIEKILDGHSPMKNEAWDTEVVCLFLRKSLELLAFSTLIAQKEVYATVYADFSQHWKVQKLLQRLATLNPNFYPKPAILPSTSADGIRHLQDLRDDYLTIDDFEIVYNFCSEVIHTWNPYREDPRVVQTVRPMREWLHRLKRLLDFHYISLLGEQGYWVVQMNHPVDGKVHAFLCEPVKVGSDSSVSASSDSASSDSASASDSV